MEVLADTSPCPLCTAWGVYVQNVSQGSESRKKKKKLNRPKNLPSHKGLSFLCFLPVSQTVRGLEEWNCCLILVGWAAEMEGGG